MCLIPFFFMNSWNSELVKLLPLPLTSVAGRPCVANISLSFSIVAVDVMRCDALPTTSSMHPRLQGTFLLCKALHSQCRFLTKGVPATPRGVMVLLRVHSDLPDICRSPSPSSQSPDPCPATIHSFVLMLSCEIRQGGPHAAR